MNLSAPRLRVFLFPSRNSWYTMKKPEDEHNNMTHFDIQKHYRLEADKHGAFGVLYGYEAGVISETRFDTYYAVVSFLFAAPLTATQQESVRTAMNTLHANVSFPLDGKVVRLDMPGSFATKRKFERADAILQAATTQFATLGLAQHAGCGLCEGDGFDRLRLVRGLAMKTHDACHEKLMEEVREHYRKIDTSTVNLGKGYLFAVGGATLGAIVNFLVYYFGGYQVVWLYALIPAAAMFFYKAAKAPQRKEIPFVIAGISVVASVIGIVLTYAMFAASWGVTLPVFLVEGLPDVDVMTLFLTDLGVAFLFSVLGVLIVWRYLFKTRT